MCSPPGTGVTVDANQAEVSRRRENDEGVGDDGDGGGVQVGALARSRPPCSSNTKSSGVIVDGISLVGRVTTLNMERRFGFIRTESAVARRDQSALSSPSVFDALEAGRRVAFISVETDKGYRAEAIELLGDDA